MEKLETSQQKLSRKRKLEAVWTPISALVGAGVGVATHILSEQSLKQKYLELYHETKADLNNNELYNVLTYDDLLNLANQGVIPLGDIQETAMQAGISAGGLAFFLLCYAPILLKKRKLKNTNEKDEELSA